jgi:hypothetical protein
MVRSLALLSLFSAECLIAGFAQTAVPSPSPSPRPSSRQSVQTDTNETLSPIVVIGRENSLIGIAGSASEYYYDLDLFSNFTYFLDNPILGDQFEQKDQRIVSGLTIDHKIFSQWFGRDVNLLNSRVEDIAYYYASRLKNEPPGPDGGGYNDLEFHPVEPFSFRVTVTARF